MADKKSKLDLAKEAQVEVQATMNEKRIEFLEALSEFKSIGGEDDIEAAVLDIAKHFKRGIPFLFLQSVFPEASLLKAREELKKKGKIEQIGKKGNYTLKLVETQ